MRFGRGTTKVWSRSSAKLREAPRRSAKLTAADIVCRQHLPGLRPGPAELCIMTSRASLNGRACSCITCQPDSRWRWGGGMFFDTSIEVDPAGLSLHQTLALRSNKKRDPNYSNYLDTPLPAISTSAAAAPCIVHCTLYIVHCTLYIVHCTPGGLRSREPRS